MAGPTVQSRLARRSIVMSEDGALVAQLRAALPEGWSLVQANDLSEIGGFAEILQHRFILLDLDATAAFDPLEVIRQARSGMMLNIAIICFGGSPERREAARLARADRFFERGEIAGRLAAFCEQFGW